MDRVKKIFTEGFEVSLNWNLLFAFMAFWSYGFFGYFSKSSFGLVNNILITVLTCGIFLFFLHTGLENKGRKYRVTKEGIIVFASYFFVLLVLSWHNLTNPINGDHEPYVQHAKAHSFYIVEKLAEKIPSVADLPFWFVTWGVEIVIILFFVSLWLIARRLNTHSIVFIFGSIFLALRVVIFHQGGNPDPYPAFGLFPIWISGVLLPGTDFSFRLSDFIPLIIFTSTVYYFVRQYLPKVPAWLFGLLIGTIPVFWHVGTLVEFSVWTAGGWMMFLFWLILDKEKKLFSVYTLVAVLVVCSSIRVSGPAALIFVFGLLVQMWYTKKITTQEVIKILTPCLLIVPLIIQNHYVGSPAAYDGVAYPQLGIIENASLLDRLEASFSTGVVINSTLNSFSLLYIVIVCLLPVLLLLRKKYLELAICVGLLGIAYLMFYSIDPWLWGNGRYQAEYVFPFLAVALFLLVSKITSRAFQVACIVVCIGFNIFCFYRIPLRNEGWYGHKNYFPQAKVRGVYSIQFEYPIDFKSVFVLSKEVGFEGYLYYPGYFYLHFILSGDSIKNVMLEKEIMTNVGASMGTSTVANINNNKIIKVVFIPLYPKDEDSIEDAVYAELKQSGWVDWKELYDPVYKQTTKGLVRK